MEQTQKAVLLLAKIYTDAKAGLGDGHLDGTEIFALFMDAAPAAGIQWKLIPGESKVATLDERIAVIKGLNDSLPEDPSKSKIVNGFSALLFGVGIAS